MDPSLGPSLPCDLWGLPSPVVPSGIFMWGWATACLQGAVSSTKGAVTSGNQQESPQRGWPAAQLSPLLCMQEQCRAGGSGGDWLHAGKYQYKADPSPAPAPSPQQAHRALLEGQWPLDTSPPTRTTSLHKHCSETDQLLSSHF